MTSKDIENVAIYRNVHYKADVEYSIGISRMLLTPIGIWPLQRGDSIVDRIKTFVQIGIIFGLICFFFVPQVIYTFVDCEDLKRYMNVIASQVFSTLAIIKFWTMVINRKEIRYCLTKMEMQYKNVELEEDRLVMKKSARVGRFLTTLYLGLSYGGGLPYHIVLPLISDRIVKEDNTTQIPLPYLSDYVFFVIETSPSYEIIFVTQLLISFIVLSTNCGIYTLIVNIAMHSCGLFEVVSRKIEISFERDKEGLHAYLNNIVRHHLKAIKFTGTIENAFTMVFLAEIISCTFIICLIEYGVIMYWEDGKALNMVTYVILILSIFLVVFILSFIGDRVQQESEKVGETSYFLQWYNLPDDLAKNIKMIILRTHRPTSLTAGKLFNLSLQGFSDVCKTSAAYFNFLRTVMI